MSKLLYFNLIKLESRPCFCFFTLKLRACWYLFAFADDEVIHLASDFWWFNPTSGTRNCNVLPADMSRNNNKRHGFFQEFCNITSSTSHPCHVELNSWLLSISSSTRPLKQGSTGFFNALTLLLYIFILLKTIVIWTLNVKGYLTFGIILLRRNGNLMMRNSLGWAQIGFVSWCLLRTAFS